MATPITPELFEAEAMPYLNDIYRTASRLAGGKAEAEDLVQEVFMQAWKSFDQYQIGTNCRAWLYKILFNKFDHHRRKLYTRAKYFQEVDELVYDNAAFTPSVSEFLSDEQILKALDKLPEHYRKVILLTDVHDFSYKEAAEILNVPIGTIMSRLNRARTQLRVSLSGVAEEYGVIAKSKVAFA